MLRSGLVDDATSERHQSVPTTRMTPLSPFATAGEEKLSAFGDAQSTICSAPGAEGGRGGGGAGAGGGEISPSLGRATHGGAVPSGQPTAPP